MKIRFDNRCVLVTGASTGIGRETAIDFARSGAAVVVNYYQSKDAAHEVVELIKAEGAAAIAIQADVSSSRDVQRLVHQSLEFGHNRIDILVNNAGSLLERRLLQNMTEELWDRCMAVNLKSTYLVSQAVIPHMKKNGFGRIINLASIASRNGGGIGAGHYAAAKAGVLSLTKSLAKELAQTGITVNAVAPGIIATPFHEKFTTKEIRDKFFKMIPIGREGKPEDVAYTILFLASDYAGYILGETIEINGGMLMD